LANNKQINKELMKGVFSVTFYSKIMETCHKLLSMELFHS